MGKPLEGKQLRDAKIAAALAAGLPSDKAGEFAGCSERTVFNVKGDPFIVQLMGIIASVITSKVDHAEQLALNDLMRRYEEGLGEAVAAHQDALKSSDPKLRYQAAQAWIERLAGKARSTNVNIVGGKVEHQHTHEIPEETLRLLDAQARVVSRLLPAGQGEDVEVVEGEIVGSKDGSGGA